MSRRDDPPRLLRGCAGSARTGRLVSSCERAPRWSRLAGLVCCSLLLPSHHSSQLASPRIHPSFPLPSPPHAHCTSAQRESSQESHKPRTIPYRRVSGSR
ncbi:hypothetical protein BDZ90DRAFT_37180 [Jaminaea rosea]|uniref:Uncharacterized protein n=1 Tax=Jaminaea rosea TaxID=1569628 RepID=A0A316V0T4_9BASI|nr:hypothetical protein BDZ90DRAFT_37180 [Jaminaea rosea]PWN31159.1 hypothetical protein BDZ90DRAFT_37180 [Jaminaea rosea]